MSKCLIKQICIYREKNQETILGVSVSYLISFQSIAFILRKMLGQISTNLIRGQIFLHYMFVGLILLLVTPLIVKKLTKNDVIVFTAISIFILISLFISKTRDIVLIEAKNFLFPCMLLFLLIRLVENYKKTIECLRWGAYVIVCAQLMEVSLFRHEWELYEYSMTVGYQSLIASALILASLSIKWRWIDLVLYLFAVSINIIAGTRGPLFIAIALLFVIGFYRLRVSKRLRNAMLTVVSLLVLTMISILFYSDDIIKLLSANPDLQRYSRIFKLLVSGDLFTSTTRISIYNVAFNQIIENPIIGVGFANDRALIAETIIGQLPKETNIIAGYYPHNLFLELMVQFGAVFGALLILLLIRYSILAFCHNDSIEFRVLMIVSFFIGVVPLMISNSYLRWPPFYAYLGLISSSVIVRKKLFTPLQVQDYKQKNNVEKKQSITPENR